MFTECLFFWFIISELCLFIGWSGLPSLSNPQEIMLLMTNAQAAAGVWGFTAQSRLRGQEYPLGKTAGVVGNEKAPTLSSAAKWDTNQMLPHQTRKLKGLLCWPEVLSSRRGRQSWGWSVSVCQGIHCFPPNVGWTGSWDIIRSHQKWGILEMGWAGFQLSKTGWKLWDGSKEWNGSRSSQSRKALFVHQNENRYFPFPSLPTQVGKGILVTALRISPCQATSTPLLQLYSCSQHSRAK